MENGAAVLLQMGGLPDDSWQYDAVHQIHSGRRTRMTFQLADTIDVRLVEANPLTGGLIFDIPAMNFSARSR